MVLFARTNIAVSIATRLMTTPTGELRGIVDKWLREVLPRGSQGDFVLTVAGKEPKLQQVSFLGVFPVAFTEDVDKEIILRIRLANSPETWACVLRCPDHKMAISLMVRAQPDVVRYMARMVAAQSIKDERLTSAPTPRGFMKRARRDSRILKSLASRDIRRKFCYAIGSHVDDSGQISTDTVKESLRQVLWKNLTDRDFFEAFLSLVGEGILHPVNWKRDDFFKPTPCFWEFYEIQRLNVRRAERERLQHQLQRCEGEIVAANKQHTDFLRKAAEAQARATDLESTAAELRAKIQEFA